MFLASGREEKRHIVAAAASEEDSSCSPLKAKVESLLL